ncbi:hypothetical protein TGS27_1815 [Geobacillus stearothermophilus]|uniref:Uncharacterized protein n=1 Tax=Geobacillus stearothermophilus TaxID=1422 RepID=A0ABQ7HIF1_GEOSE|nr:hypothetical protein GS8_274 [Geobacillus stearothermophilus]OAO80919.1 hypothetical protein TGS27_1815 [Geobacillus stearothermophilus]
MFILALSPTKIDEEAEKISLLYEYKKKIVTARRRDIHDFK